MLYKSKLLTLETMVHSLCILMSIVVWAQVTVFTHVMSYDVDWDRLGTSGRTPHTRETPPDFREWYRVTRHSRVFRGLTGCQLTPGKWGVTFFLKEPKRKCEGEEKHLQ